MTNEEFLATFGDVGAFAGDYYYCYDKSFFKWADNLGIKEHLYYPETEDDCACWIYKLENSFDFFLKLYYALEFKEKLLDRVQI